MNNSYQSVLSVIKATLSDSPLEINNDFDAKAICTILDEQAILPLFYSTIASSVSDVTEIISWKNRLYQIMASNVKVQNIESQLIQTLQDSGIEVAVLKGSAAAYYYPNPQYRVRGDIDIIVRPEQFELTEKVLEENEYEVDSRYKYFKHKNYKKHSIDIELHRYFINNDEENEQSEEPIPINPNNDLILQAISQAKRVKLGNYCTCVLPNDINGIVLLVHIAQHLQKGIGLRQIIDWFMFVRACLDDEMWYSSFQEKARITGLETLAITVTRMCQIHLGLTTENITWCKDADEAVCEDLMQYVMDCGNFGRSRELLQSSAVEKLPSISHPFQFIRFLQNRGEMGWKALKKHPYLKPFAWIYQFCRYIKLAFQNKVTPNKLKSIYDEGNKRNEMFAALGLK